MKNTFTLEENFQLLLGGSQQDDAKKIEALRSAFAFGACVGSLRASQAVRKAKSPEELEQNLAALNHEIELFTAGNDGPIQ